VVEAAADSVTVNVNTVVPLLPSDTDAVPTEAAGGGRSLSAIEAVWEAIPLIAYALLVPTVRITVSELSTRVSSNGVTVSVTFAVSFGSYSVSPFTVTANVFEVWPIPNETVPDAAT